jgi:hypothetical protein
VSLVDVDNDALLVLEDFLPIRGSMQLMQSVHEPLRLGHEVAVVICRGGRRRAREAVVACIRLTVRSALLSFGSECRTHVVVVRIGLLLYVGQ